MLEKTQKKLINAMILLDLLKMKHHIPYDPEVTLRMQDRRVRRLARKAYKIPFYRTRFDAAGITPEDIRCADDLSKLPLLYKDELRAWMRELDKEPRYRDWYHDTTSGSSGVPLMVLVSPREKAYNMANWFRVLLTAGYNPFLGKTMSRISAHSVTGEHEAFFQKMGILRRGFLNQYAPEEEMVRQMNEYRPDLLYMNKTELMRMCLYCKQNGVEVVKPRFFCPTGEKIDSAARRLFTEILGPNIIDSYGTAEAGACMVKLGESGEYTVHNDSFVVRVYDDEDKMSDEGRIVVTPLYKTDLPLINYVVGDKAAAVNRDGVIYISDVKGRMNDAFKYENGEVTTFFEIAPIIAHCEDIIQIRFIQEDYNNITVQCVHNTEETARGTDEIEADLTRRLNEKFKKPFALDFNWMNVIPPDDNGKLRMIVCKV